MLVALVAAGCGRRAGLGVSLKNLPSELVFGIPPLPEAIAAANTLPIDLLPLSGVGGVPGPKFVPLADTEFECEDAPLGAAPQEAAPDSILKPPAAGTYRYKTQVRIIDLQLASTGFETRTISDVRVTNPAGPNFNYKVTQKLAAGPVDIQIITTYSVDQTSPRPERRGPTEVPQVSARGIFVTSIERKGRVGGDDFSQTFQPNPPLKYFDLPGRIGSDGAVDTTAVDSGGTFTTIRHRGEPVRHEPVDACGEVTDSWYLETIQTVTAPDGQTFETKLAYGIATHLGGMIIVEHIEIPANEPEVIFDFSIAELKPGG